MQHFLYDSLKHKQQNIVHAQVLAKCQQIQQLTLTWNVKQYFPVIFSIILILCFMRS